MAKSRINRKETKRLKQKQAFSVATQVRLLVQQIPSQEMYSTFLLQEPDPIRRRKLYDFSKVFCKFANPIFPSTIESPGIILPHR